MKAKQVSVLMVVLFLTACGEPCTEETLMKKGQELMQMIPEISKLDPQKMTEVMGKLSTIQSVDPNDLQAQCDAADALLEEIEDLL